MQAMRNVTPRPTSALSFRDQNKSSSTTLRRSTSSKATSRKKNAKKKKKTTKKQAVVEETKQQAAAAAASVGDFDAELFQSFKSAVPLQQQQAGGGGGGGVLAQRRRLGYATSPAQQRAEQKRRAAHMQLRRHAGEQAENEHGKHGSRNNHKQNGKKKKKRLSKKQQAAVLMRSVNQCIEQTETYIVARVQLANAMTHEWHLNRFYKAVRMTSAAAAAAASGGSSSSGEFRVRVYQDVPRLVLRDLDSTAFSNELHRLENRVACLKRQQGSRTADQAAAADEAAAARLSLSQADNDAVGINLKALLLDTLSMTNALTHQVRVLQRKGVCE
jgi:hypothetical protein